MQLVFTIHVIITLLMLKPATSKTCFTATLHASFQTRCPFSMYFTEISTKKLETAGICCELDDPSYFNAAMDCSIRKWASTGDKFDRWRLCPSGYFLHALRAIKKSYYSAHCCQPLHHPYSYGHCYDEDVPLSGRSRCQVAGYYITGFYESFCASTDCIRKLRCCKMTKTELCPQAWIYLEGFCYKFSPQSLTWNASKTACKNMESALAVVDSEAKQIAIGANLQGRKGYWIGLYRDPEDTSRWLWIDSSPLCKGCGYWNAGEPSNYSMANSCGEMQSRYYGSWNDGICSMKRRYICQQRVLKVTTTQQNITLDEGSTITLQCEVKFTEADEVWTFWVFRGQLQKTIYTLLQKARGTKTLSNTVKEYNMLLELKHVRLAQSGTYTCGANVTNIIRAQNISLNVHEDHDPRLEQSESTVEIANRKKRTISCIAVYPKASNVDTFWLFNGRRKQTNSKYEVNHSRFKRTEGTMKSRNISLTIYNAGLNDSGQYSCVLNTSHGLRLKNFSVQVVPDAIGNESTTGTTSSHLQTSALTRPQVTQYVRTASRSSNGVTDTNRFNTILFIVLGLLGGLIIIIIIPMTLVIKFWYRRKYKPPASVRPPPDIDENDFKYDVFVTYSRKDFSWVDRELLRLLRENQVNYCVDHKHFELGKAIVDNITDSVYQSRKVLAVWSRSYASSKYCKQELDYAIQRSFQNSDCSVIVITLDKTDRKQLPKPLRAKTFLDYSDSVERKGWEKRLIKHLKAPNYKKNSTTTIV